MAHQVKIALAEDIDALSRLSMDDLLAQRYQRLMSFGNFEEK
jgi:acetyl-CoA carboxylase alpha subunit